MEEIKGRIPIEGIKRCYAAGAIAKITCPTCGNKIEVDFGDQYLSYPEVGEDTTFYFCCEECEENGRDYEFEVFARVKSADIIIEYDPEKIFSA